MWTVLGFLGSKLGTQRPQDASLKPPPSLAPVATPRAPSHMHMPAAQDKETALRSSPGQPNALPAINPGSPRFAGVPPITTGLACGTVSTSQVGTLASCNVNGEALYREIHSERKAAAAC